jgi:uroporphyrinogen decarboxylase
MLLGYEHFSEMLADDLDFVAEIAARVGQIQCAVMRRVVKLPGVVAAWYGDDLAYTESLLASPRILRKYFFPWMEELAGIAHAAGFPFIMHSDGRLWQVLDDLIALGVNALHPIEAKAMDIYDLKRRYGQKLAIFGNVDLGYTLAEGMGTPEAIKAEVRRQIKELAPGGGYGLASGAGLTRYVRLENFLAMRAALLEYGTYPIRL